MYLETSIVVPTRNERDNIHALVDRTERACASRPVELVFVDDSTDDTPHVIEAAARDSRLDIGLLHREGAARTGGLSGAVVAGLRAARADWAAVMDGDLQHPPELLPLLMDRAARADVDMVVASRYCGGGGADGLSGCARRTASRGTTMVAKAVFPQRLRHCTDPMTGFFLVRRSAVDIAALRPQGFKILLEILIRNPLRVAEVPFVFEERCAGDSKASLRNGAVYLRQLAVLRVPHRRAAASLVSAAP